MNTPPDASGISSDERDQEPDLPPVPLSEELHHVRNLLYRAIYDMGGETVEGAFVDHWQSNAVEAMEELHQHFSRFGFSGSDANLVRQAIRAASDRPESVRQLLQYLGRHHQGLRSLVEEMRSDSEPAARVAAIHAGAHLFDLSFILELLDDPDPSVRAAAVSTLAQPQITPQVEHADQRLERALDDPAPEVRIAAAAVVRFCNAPSGGDALVRRLDVEPDLRVRKAIIHSAAARTRSAGLSSGYSGRAPLRDVIGQPLTRMLLHELNHEDAEIRKSVIGALERIGGAEVATAMLERLAIEEDPSVRLALVHSPGANYNLITERALPLFTSFLQFHPDPSFRSWVAISMGSLGSIAAPALMAALDDPSSSVQRAATMSLQKVGDARALPRLLLLYADPAQQLQRRDYELAVRDITIRAETAHRGGIPSEAAEQLQNRVNALQPEGLTQWPTRVFKEEHNALPVHSNSLFIWAVKPDGSILCMDHAAFGHPTEPEVDPLVRFAVTIQGAKRYPELSALLPPPPRNTKVCDRCLGVGFFRAESGSASCFQCNGLGWRIN